MLLSTQTEVLGPLFGEPQAIRMLAQAGFDAFVLSLFSMFSDPNYAMNRPDYQEYAASLRSPAGIPSIENTTSTFLAKVMSVGSIPSHPQGLTRVMR